MPHHTTPETTGASACPRFVKRIAWLVFGLLIAWIRSPKRTHAEPAMWNFATPVTFSTLTHAPICTITTASSHNGMVTYSTRWPQ